MCVQIIFLNIKYSFSHSKFVIIEFFILLFNKLILSNYNLTKVSIIFLNTIVLMSSISILIYYQHYNLNIIITLLLSILPTFLLIITILTKEKIIPLLRKNIYAQVIR